MFCYWALVCVGLKKDTRLMSGRLRIRKGPFRALGARAIGYYAQADKWTPAMRLSYSLYSLVHNELKAFVV